MEWKYRPERKASLHDLIQIIRDTVSMDDVVRVYAPNPPPRHRRIPCPIHAGEDYNLSFTDKGFCCFVCGAKGDQIAFVKDVLGLSTKAEAVRRLNQDLGLGLPIDSPVPSGFSAEAAKRREEADRKRQELAEWSEEREALEDEWAILDTILRSPDTDYVTKAKATERIARVQHALLSYPEEPR